MQTASPTRWPSATAFAALGLTLPAVTSDAARATLRLAVAREVAR